ncbi:MAG: Ig-like domain-containing protein [Thermoplasmatota archaeon]
MGASLLRGFDAEGIEGAEPEYILQTAEMGILEGSLVNITYDEASQPFATLETVGSAFGDELIWKDLELDHAPNMRNAIDMIGIPGTGKVLLFGGDHNGGAYNEYDTWLFDIADGEWSQYLLDPRPPGSESYGMARLWGTDQVLLFGGYINYAWSNETWTFDLSEMDWERVHTPLSPMGRICMNMASIWNTQKVVMFGGYKMEGDNRTYVYDHRKGDWEVVLEEGGPKYRRGGIFAPVHGTDKVLFYNSDYVIDKGLFHETWTYDLSDNRWTNMTPASNPGTVRLSRCFGDLVPGQDRVLYSDGVQTWYYDLSDNEWTKVNTTGDPVARSDHGFCNIPGTGKYLLFGGLDYHDTIGNGTFIFDIEAHVKSGRFRTGVVEIPGEASPKDIIVKGCFPAGTSYKYRVRSGTSSSLEGSEFLGPNGNTADHYHDYNPRELWSGHEGDTHFQVEMELSTTDHMMAPTIGNITILFLVEDFDEPPYVVGNGSPLFIYDGVHLPVRTGDPDTDSLLIDVEYSFDNQTFQECRLDYRSDNPLEVDGLSYLYETEKEFRIEWRYKYDLDGTDHNKIYVRMTPRNEVAGEPFFFELGRIDLKPPEITTKWYQPPTFDVDEPILLEFSEEMEPYLLHSSYIEVTDENDAEEPVTFSVEGTRVLIEPVNFWKPEMRYIIFIDGSVIDLNGNNLGIDHIYNFNTRGAGDFDLLERDFPDAKEGRVERNRTFNITFEMDLMDNPTNLENIVMMDRYDQVLEIEKRIDGDTISITPVHPLGFDREYAIFVDGKLVSTSGERLSEPLDIKVRTEVEWENGGTNQMTILMVIMIVMGILVAIVSITSAFYFAVRDRRTRAGERIHGKDGKEGPPEAYKARRPPPPNGMNRTGSGVKEGKL